MKRTGTTQAKASPFSLPGVPNCHRVATGLLRGAQPTREGLLALRDAGVCTVIGLRVFHSDEKLGIREMGLSYEHISFRTWHPKEEHLSRFLSVVTDPAACPVFVHCQHGADRTGVMCAVYRIVVQGWDKEDAIREMVHGGFGHHRRIWRHLAGFVRRIDPERLRK